MTAAAGINSSGGAPGGIPGRVTVTPGGLRLAPLRMELGRRAALAIPVGLALQAYLGHGGFSALGVNGTVPVSLVNFTSRRKRPMSYCVPSSVLSETVTGTR